MANTLIQLKYSTVTAKPASLNIAEPAYSYTSNTLFIGTPDSLGTINIGGLFYTSQIDNATNLSVPNTLVERDATGNISVNILTANGIVGTIAGNSDTATKLQTARDIGLAGDATGNVSFDGSANVTLTVDLTDTGVAAGTYGGSANIPFFTVDVEGRISAAGNTAISTNLEFSGDTGTGSLNLLTDTLGVKGQDGISTTANNATNTILVSVDNTVIRTTGTQSITGDLTVTGNIVLNGNTFTQNVSSISVADPLIVLGVGNYFSDNFDIGFVAHYNDGANSHTGLIRDAGTKEYHFFKGYTGELDANNNIDLNHASYQEANVSAAYFKGNLIANTAVSDGFYGKTSTNQMYLYPSETYNTLGDQYIVLDPTAPNHIHIRAGGAIDSSNAELFLGGESTGVQVSDTFDTTYIRANTQVWQFGNTGSLILPNNNQIYDNATSIFVQTVRSDNTAPDFLYYDNTTKEITRGDIRLPNSSYTITGALAASNTITSLTVDSYGRVTAATGAKIEIDANQITSGTLLVDRGGSGASTFTLNGVLLGNGNNAFQTASSSTEGHILTINNSGVPTFSMLSGGTF
jgi:hypothetical protein